MKKNDNPASSTNDLPNHEKCRRQERGVLAKKNQHCCDQPSYLMGWICAGLWARTPWGTRRKLIRVFQNLASKNTFLNIFSMQRAVEFWNVAEFILDLLILIVVVSDLCRFVQWRRWHKGSFTHSGYLCSLRHFPAPKVTQITIG